MNDWKERLGMVYSTDPTYKYEKQATNNASTPPPEKQRLRVALDKRNRGGKKVTLVADFIGSDDDLQLLGKILKTKCGVGGAAKDGQIIIQGDLRQKVVTLLTEMGYNARLI